MSLLLLSGMEMLSDKAAREGVLAEATHLAGRVYGIRGERHGKGELRRPRDLWFLCLHIKYRHDLLLAIHVAMSRHTAHGYLDISLYRVLKCPDFLS